LGFLSALFVPDKFHATAHSGYTALGGKTF